MDYCTDSLGDPKMLSALEATSSCWQIEIEYYDRDEFSLTSRCGLFHFVRMLFGLCKEPSTFQRTKDTIQSWVKWCFGLSGWRGHLSKTPELHINMFEWYSPCNWTLVSHLNYEYVNFLPARLASSTMSSVPAVWKSRFKHPMQFVSWNRWQPSKNSSQFLVFVTSSRGLFITLPALQPYKQKALKGQPINFRKIGSGDCEAMLEPKEQVVSQPILALLGKIAILRSTGMLGVSMSGACCYSNSSTAPGNRWNTDLGL